VAVKHVILEHVMVVIGVVLLVRSRQSIGQARRSLRWWHGQWSRHLHQEAEAIRNGLLQETFVLRRQIELYQAQATTAEQVLATADQFHLALKALSDRLSPPYSDDSLPHALRHSVAAWQLRYPTLAVSLGESNKGSSHGLNHELNRELNRELERELKRELKRELNHELHDGPNDRLRNSSDDCLNDSPNDCLNDSPNDWPSDWPNDWPEEPYERHRLILWVLEMVVQDGLAAWPAIAHLEMTLQQRIHRQAPMGELSLTFVGAATASPESPPTLPPSFHHLRHLFPLLTGGTCSWYCRDADWVWRLTWPLEPSVLVYPSRSSAIQA
jgi:hypothetical protein